MGGLASRTEAAPSPAPHKSLTPTLPQHGPTLVAVKITKNGKGKDATYTCAYTLRETRTEELF